LTEQEVTREFFAKYETAETGPTKIKFVSGSVEAACGLGLADGIVDLVETGTTMRAAGLEIVETIMHTQAVLIKNPCGEHPDLVKTLRCRIEGYQTANMYQMIQYNISRDNLADALKANARPPSCVAVLPPTPYRPVL
jgi:ATP phosphoribosyltransferase